MSSYNDRSVYVIHLSLPAYFYTSVQPIICPAVDLAPSTGNHSVTRLDNLMCSDHFGHDEPKVEG